ncbi:MAG: DUF4136 domain-containing protein [Bacteroidetes bacterium]|nr:DUF4136 domain-containing protein [Bacteroidota bacterium]HET6244110.1 DUF4136 domain-containing protein [Bacteroidia bacterium]
MKNIFFTIAIAAILSLLDSCSSTQVYSDRAKGVDFSKFSTYAWLPVVDTSSGSLYYNDIVEQNLVDKVNNEMNARNYRLDVNNPELLILLHVNFEQEQEQIVSTYPLYNTYPYFFDGFSPLYIRPYHYPYYNTLGTVYATDVENIEYTTGTVVVDIIRNSDDKLIWRGWSKERINPNTPSRELEELVSKIFNEFPVKEQKEMSESSTLPDQMFK